LLARCGHSAADGHTERIIIIIIIILLLLLLLFLYLLYTSDLPELGNSTVVTFADDTAILAVGTTMRNLQGSYKQP
jgi:hypothetical protein